MYSNFACLIKKKFNTGLVYNGKYLKTKIKSHENLIKTNIHNKKLPPKKSLCLAHTITLLDLVFQSDKNYYPKTFLEECKHKFNEEIMKIFIIIKKIFVFIF